MNVFGTIINSMALTVNSTIQNDSYFHEYSENYGYVYNDYDSGLFEQYDLFVYKGFHFERAIYLVVWELLVILTALVNIVVITVFLRRSMRNSTNMILVSVAVTDSMTGLVTLPVYSYIYSRQDQGDLHLTKTWCETFMIVKFFVSKSFHTMSIWLTVCLGFQRLVSVCFPFRAHSLFTMPRTAVMILSVVLMSPLLHVYHLLHTKSVSGDDERGSKCMWELEEPCVEGCIHLWLLFYFMHFIPSMLLVMFTAAMVFVLCKSFKKMRTSHLITNKDNLLRRTSESRRISFIVVVVVIVFLVPEIPYGLFVLLSVTFHLSRVGLMELRTNRVFLCVYEVSLVLSFHANFWIYFIMNRRFRRSLKKLFEPCSRLCWRIMANIGRRRRLRRRSESSSFTNHPNTRNTSGGLEMNTWQARQGQKPE